MITSQTLKTRISFLVAVGTMIVACGCTTQNSATPSAVALHVGYSKLRISLPIFVAAERGIFQAHGLNVQLEPYETAQPMAQALLEGKIDIAGYTAMPITYGGMARTGKQLYFITTMVEDSTHRISFFLRRRTPVEGQARIASIRDLKGKKIGILPTIAYKAWLGAILRANGIDPDTDVTIQQIAPEQEGQTLATGGIDALFTNDPVATAAIRSGVAELISNEVECPKYISDPFPFGSFNVSKEWGDSHKEEFEKLVASIDEAAQFVNSHPEDAKRSLLPYLGAKYAPDVAFYPDARYLLSTESTVNMYQQLSVDFVRLKIIPSPISMAGLVVTKH